MFRFYIFKPEPETSQLRDRHVFAGLKLPFEAGSSEAQASSFLVSYRFPALSSLWNHRGPCNTVSRMTFCTPRRAAAPRVPPTRRK